MRQKRKGVWGPGTVVIGEVEMTSAAGRWVKPSDPIAIRTYISLSDDANTF